VKKNYNYFRRVTRHLLNALNIRAASHPYVSGDTLRSLANFVFEDNILKVRRNCNLPVHPVYFCETHLLDSFISDVLPSVKTKFILISHNSDAGVSHDHLHLMESPLLFRWFAQNLEVSHAKCIPVPIGLENVRFQANGIPSYYNKKFESDDKRLDRILYNFNVSTHPQLRSSVKYILSNIEFADEIFVPAAKYPSLLSRYMFVASPSGNGTDCHRTWEALYRGAIPIVVGEDFYGRFSEFPGLVLSDWSDLFSLCQRDLRAIYSSSLRRLARCEYIWSNYWENYIGIVSSGRMG